MLEFTLITNTTIHTVNYNTVSTQNLEAKGIGFSVSPNPADDLIQVSINDLNISSGQFELLTINGQNLRQGNFTAAQFELSVKSLSPGIYILQLNDNQGNTGVQKIVIQ